MKAPSTLLPDPQGPRIEVTDCALYEKSHLDLRFASRIPGLESLRVRGLVLRNVRVGPDFLRRFFDGRPEVVIENMELGPCRLCGRPLPGGREECPLEDAVACVMSS